MIRNIFISLTALIFCCCCCFNSDRYKLKGSDLVYYHYKVHNGYSGMSKEFEIMCKDSVVSAIVRDCNFLLPNEECKVDSVSNVPREKLEEIGDMLAKANVQDWEHSYSNPDVFDGDSWSLDVKFGKNFFWSRGYMAGPDYDPTYEINKIIIDLCKPQKEGSKEE